MAKKELKKQEKLQEDVSASVSINDWVEVLKTLLQEDSWFSGVKRLTTSKKATLAVGGLLATAGSWAGLSFLVAEDGSTQTLLGIVALGVAGLILAAYQHAQGKSDQDKEAAKEETKAMAMSEVSLLLAEKRALEVESKKKETKKKTTSKKKKK